MKNRTMTIPNYVIMGFTTVVSTIFHAILFLSFGGGLFLLFSRLTAHGKPTVDDYAIVVVMFVFWMFHCLALIFLLEKSPRARTYGYSVVTLVLEVLVCPVYALVGYVNLGMPYGYIVLIFSAMMLVSLIGNIYCVIRHTIMK